MKLTSDVGFSYASLRLIERLKDLERSSFFRLTTSVDFPPTEIKAKLKSLIRFR